MTPSSLLLGACRTLVIFQLLACCLLPLGAQSQSQEFSLQMEPQDPVLPAGRSLLVNCSTSCPHPELITLETSLPKEVIGEDQGWAAFRLSNVTGDSKIICSAFCDGFQMTSSSNITVYRFPELVELDLLPPWQPVGENLTLQCHVWGGAPRAQLTLVLLRGEEELSRQPAVGEPAEGTATVLAGRGDYGAKFTCRAELDLRPRGLGLFQNTSAPRQLRTFVLPMAPPRLVTPLSLEVGTSWPVDCTLDGLFPVSEAQVQLALGDQMLNPAVTIHGDTLRATATVIAREDQEGAQEIVCNVTLGGESREARKNLTVFSKKGREGKQFQRSLPRAHSEPERDQRHRGVQSECELHGWAPSPGHAGRGSGPGSRGTRPASGNCHGGRRRALLLLQCHPGSGRKDLTQERDCPAACPLSELLRGQHPHRGVSDSRRGDCHSGLNMHLREADTERLLPREPARHLVAPQACAAE
ncbi:intercellular adhesion molecule 3 isoform X2 [Ictidomys tridecemlineatus]